MPITPNQWDAIYALKERYALCIDAAVTDAEYKIVEAAFTAVREVLTILGE